MHPHPTAPNPADKASHPSPLREKAKECPERQPFTPFDHPILWLKTPIFGRNCHVLRAIANCDSYVFHIYKNVDFEFDPDKDAINRTKHHLPLSFAQRIFDDPFYTVTETIRIGDEEERFKLIGEVDGKLFTAIHVWRGDTVRFISVRRSNSSEQRNYDRNPGRPE